MRRTRSGLAGSAGGSDAAALDRPLEPLMRKPFTARPPRRRRSPHRNCREPPGPRYYAAMRETGVCRLTIVAPAVALRVLRLVPFATTDGSAAAREAKARLSPPIAC